MITIKSDGTLDPFGLFLLRSRFQLMAPARDKRDESDEFDGEVDFGTELSCGNFSLNCVTSNNLTRAQKETTREKLAKQLNILRIGDWLIYEDDPDKMTFVRLDGRVEISEYPTWLQVTIPLRVAPLWVSVEEHSTTDSTLVNAGTFPTPVVVEITGIVDDPEVTINGETLKWTGTVGANDKLVIDTDKQTVTFNGINALALYEGTFPWIPPGETVISAPPNTVVRWRDAWI